MRNERRGRMRILIKKGDLMDKYDVIGLVIAIIAVSVVLIH
jgi:drug/metabolite transporter superfamily protein YnfA